MLRKDLSTPLFQTPTTGGFGSQLARAFGGGQLLQPTSLVTRDPHLRGFAIDAGLFKYWYDDEPYPALLVCTAQASVGDAMGYLDVFIPDANRQCMLDATGQPQRARVEGPVRIEAPAHRPDCSSCSKKQLQGTQWWPAYLPE